MHSFKVLSAGIHLARHGIPGADHQIVSLKIGVQFSPLRSDSRFATLVERGSLLSTVRESRTIAGRRLNLFRRDDPAFRPARNPGRPPASTASRAFLADCCSLLTTCLGVSRERDVRAVVQAVCSPIIQIRLVGNLHVVKRVWTEV